WRGSLRIVRTIALIIAPIGIAGMFVTGRPEWLMLVNSVLVLGMLAAIGATLVRHGSDMSTVLIRGGVITAAMFILAENLRGMGVLRWPPRMEFIGILAFV